MFPLDASAARYPHDAKSRVYRSSDAGGTWQELGKGLPDDYYVGVMRDALCTDDQDRVGVYFGDRSGSVWASADEGDSWRQIAAHLPDVMCVRAARVGAT